MLLNFAVDFLLLLGTVSILGLSPPYIRLGAAAAFGGLYSGACLIRRLSWIGYFPGRILCLMLMSITAFGWGKKTIRPGGVFLLLSLALGGAAQSLSFGNNVSLLLCAAAIFFMCRLVRLGGTVGQSYVNISICHEGKTVFLNALRDTGNCLKDPVSGEGVIVIGPEAARELTGLTKAELSSPIDTVYDRRMPGLRLMPYSAIGNSEGMMLAMRFRNATVNGKARSIIAAMAAEGMGDYEALMGGCENE